MFQDGPWKLIDNSLDLTGNLELYDLRRLVIGPNLVRVDTGGVGVYIRLVPEPKWKFRLASSQPEAHKGAS